LFYVIGLMLALVLHGVYVNVVNGHDIGLKKNLQSLFINHILVPFYIHNHYCSTWRDRVDDIRSIPFAFQFAFPEYLEL
jgi:hypothetical protein